MASDNQTIVYIGSNLKLNIGSMSVWGGRGQKRRHSCISHDAISKALKYIIVSFRCDHRSSESILLPGLLGNKLERESSP